MSERELLETIRQLDSDSQEQVMDFVRLLADRTMITTQTIKDKLTTYVQQNPVPPQDYTQIDDDLQLPVGTAQVYLPQIVD